jgi:hypothetical protein
MIPARGSGGGRKVRTGSVCRRAEVERSYLA